MGTAPARFVAAHMAADGHPRLGAGVVIQCAGGLRPSELVGLLGMDVVLPEDRGHLHDEQHAMLGLGVRAGTKAKRAQFVLIHDPVVVALVRWLRGSCNPSESLIGYSYEQYRRILAKVCSKQNLSHLRWTPHSPRSGFASECIASGMGFIKTMQLGRWISESSARAYVDITTSASILITFKLQHLSEALAYCNMRILSFFTGADKCLVLPPPDRHGSLGLEDGQGHQHVHASVLLGSGRGGAGRAGVEVSEVDEASWPVGHPASADEPAEGTGDAMPHAGGSRARGRARHSSVRAAVGRGRGGAGHSGSASRGSGRGRRSPP